MRFWNLKTQVVVWWAVCCAVWVFAHYDVQETIDFSEVGELNFVWVFALATPNGSQQSQKKIICPPVVAEVILFQKHLVSPTKIACHEEERTTTESDTDVKGTTIGVLPTCTSRCGNEQISQTCNHPQLKMINMQFECGREKVVKLKGKEISPTEECVDD